MIIQDSPQMQKPNPTTPPMLSPITNINIQQLQAEQCNSDDPETQTQNQSRMEVEYTQTHKYTKGDKQRDRNGDEEKDTEREQERDREFIGRESRRRRTDGDQGIGGSFRAIGKVEIQKRKNRRYENKSTMPQYNTIQRFNNPSNSLIIQSSSQSLFSSKPPNQPLNLNSKLSRKDSQLSQTTQFQDSRRTLNPQPQPCFPFPLQRLITFLLIYQVVIVYCLMVSLMLGKFIFMLGCVVLLLPTYFGSRCVWGRGRMGVYGALREISQNDSEIVPAKKTKKIHNSYFLNPNQNPPQIPTPHLSFLSNSLSLCLPHTSPKKPLLTIPYLHNNQVQHFQKCLKCPSPYTNTRIKHCNRCGICHYGYDHYCVWLGVCVDGGNYGDFMWFVLGVWIVGVVGVGGGVWVGVGWVWGGIGGGVEGGMGVEFGVWCFTVLESLLGLVFCTYILVYHLWLNIMGVSTRQHFSGSIKNPNNNLLCKSLCYTLPQQYQSLFLENIQKQTQSETSAKIIQDYPKQ